MFDEWDVVYEKLDYIACVLEQLADEVKKLAENVCNVTEEKQNRLS